MMKAGRCTNNRVGYFGLLQTHIMMKAQFLTFLSCLLLCSFLTHAQQLSAPTEEPLKTVIEVGETSYDFGQIKSGEIASHVFRFTNTGDYPLTIINAKGSCGCTVPFYPTVPILPGESSEIEVAFDSKGKTGKQAKRVTITANTDPAQTFLTISGEVLPADGEVSEEKPDASDLQAIKALDPNCMAIFPNPTSDILQLELKEHIGLTAVVDVHNESGKTVLTKSIDRISRESTQLDVEKFQPGVYLITIHIDGFKPLTQCFVKSGD
jgi:hypothetical protein